ncbi:beta-1,3-galactosyl-O-glycosyl-glycoprotein beta-1,6-N-acetylglucosaminyltransferase 3-like [Limanda limanda]|uniref:beta-1,3-galactosyl-O-glycosyl-glycoprotein beta-1,6-N-acetylglucosaminyltransferase 3-like n=1 Tax=Limanda limanda TaxID=27771 RepID=UPI0029C8B536|nr:beta-1,3-galactosyl-O-glycosyl-glycoprotein beta-1,6-N-acetylglucosaminyltransferase 3-like [Limanda limanda]XP_060933196.1 beta-1,3-galactosyl-O-glycosyl-glycoprotein beta-1,6-N-acetylglucosaminyltransferase 3-like [Limanda limanda]
MECHRVPKLRILCFIFMGMFLAVVFWGAGSGKWSSADLVIPEQFYTDLPVCLAIISGYTEGKISELKELLASGKKHKKLSEDFYLNVTKDCPAYIKQRDFITVPLSEEENDFPIAYSIVIHEKIEMFERLLRAVYAPQNSYCVHVDQKSSEEFHMAVEAIVACFPNVFIATKLEKVIYASWSRVQADLNCMTDLLKSPVKWRYLLNTCGTDFPIKTNGEMVKILKILNGRNSMETVPPPDYKKARWQYHHNVTDSVIRTDEMKSPPPISSPVFIGIAYIVVSRAFVSHVMQDTEVQKLMEWSKDTYSPDEHLWATLQRMPSVPGSTPADRKFDLSDLLSLARVVKWGSLAGDVKKGNPYPHCTGVYRRAVCVYGAGDLQWLLSQQHLLANKFDAEVDDIAIRCLETVLRFRASGLDPLLKGQSSTML